MTRRIDLEELFALLDEDRAFFDDLVRWGLLSPDQREVDATELDQILVAKTLVRELEVNWPGVEIILRLRAELLATRRQIAELLEQLRREAAK